MLEEVEEQRKTKKSDLHSYSARRTLLATMVAHVAVFLFTSFMAYTAMPGSSLFSWHPFLMTLAFVLFMTEAILMFSQQSSLVRTDRKLQVRSHWILQTLMVTCCVSGFLVIYVNKNQNGRPHFTSWHGLLGLCTVISCCGQAAAGVFLLYPFLIKRFVTLAQAKIYHATYGLCNYTLVTAVLNLAMWTSWATANITGVYWYACVVCIDVLALVIMTQVTSNYLPRLRRQRQ